VTNFAVIGQIVAEIWRFLIFRDSGRRHIGLLKFRIFKGWKGQEGQNVSPRQISRRKVELLVRYDDFSIFQDGGRRHLGFSKSGKFRGWERSRGSKCVITPNLASIGQTIAEIWRFFDFSKMAAVRHLGFVMSVFGPPTKGIWWSLSLCKIWLESSL